LSSAELLRRAVGEPPPNIVVTIHDCKVFDHPLTFLDACLAVIKQLRSNNRDLSAHGNASETAAMMSYCRVCGPGIIG
jgi:hypothetical protein